MSPGMFGAIGGVGRPEFEANKEICPGVRRSCAALLSTTLLANLVLLKFRRFVSARQGEKP
jgi:hypothetical protein